MEDDDSTAARDNADVESDDPAAESERLLAIYDLDGDGDEKEYTELGR